MSDTGKERRTRHPRLVLDIGEEGPCHSTDRGSSFFVGAAIHYREQEKGEGGLGLQPDGLQP